MHPRSRASSTAEAGHPGRRDGPRCIQDASKMAQDSPKTAQHGPKTGPRGPREYLPEAPERAKSLASLL
eukprot:5452467-Pyramimonas_sp.AAC.1